MFTFVQKLVRQRPGTILFAILIVAFVLGGLTTLGCSDSQQSRQDHNAGEEKQVQFWTCSMHPQIQKPGPGKCPICGMDLIPVSSDGSEEEAGLRELTLSPRAVKLAEIQTAPVERKFVSAEIRMDGKVHYDETRLAYITAWVPGRIERLYVDYTGVSVSKGDHLVSLYSPELITTQQELHLGLKMLKNKTGRLLESTRKNVEATRKKLRLWGLTKDQINVIEKSGKVSDQTTIYSPISGIVIHKNGFEGMYIKTGTRIYTVADFSQVWIKLDAYEKDLVWIRYGQEVEFEAGAYPGEVFKGRITFIDPILDSKTRTVKVRVNVPNPDGKLKPEMFVKARVYPQVASSDKVITPDLAGKWICPMHPEIIKDSQASCDICGMPLVTAKSLGYVSIEAAQSEAPLVIPATAPLITGKRAVVYVAKPEKEGTFEGREIVLGPRTGSYYIVKEGLTQGEKVVVNGNFKIDSAIQILAKPSMMNPGSKAAMTGPDHKDESRPEPAKETLEKYEVSETFQAQMDGLVSAYFAIHQALSRDNFNKAKDGAQKFLASLATVDMLQLKGKAHMAWMAEQKQLNEYAQAAVSAKDIDTFRSRFDLFSDTLYSIIKQFGTSGKLPIYRYHCPMAKGGQGAYWLQGKTETENPYYGSAMFRCGSKVEEVSPGLNAKQTKGDAHE